MSPEDAAEADEELAGKAGSLTFGRLRSLAHRAPLCRHHHRCKQAEGWLLEQPEPGVLVWRVPSGRTYTTTPTEYAI